MRSMLLLLTLTMASYATSFSVNDPFGQPKCPPGVTVGCDVVGPTTEFDFKLGNFNFGATSGSIEIYMDYGPAGATNLAPFNVTGTTVISVADLLFYAPGGNIYAIPLFNRTTSSWGSATAGTVYKANSSASLLSSDIVLFSGGNPVDVYYRGGTPVWINTNQASAVSVGSVTVSSGAAQGTTWLVTVNFSYAAGSQIANDFNASGLNFFTGTATCGNDVAQSNNVVSTATPEPSSMVMLSSGIGLALLAAIRRRRS